MYVEFLLPEKLNLSSTKLESVSLAIASLNSPQSMKEIIRKLSSKLVCECLPLSEFSGVRNEIGELVFICEGQDSIVSFE
jgi:hypothetical protein